MAIERFFQQHAVFRHEELVQWVSLTQGSVKSLENLLSYYLKAG